MFIWILAVFVVGVVTLVGYYQGGIRAAVSLIGILVATLLAGAVGFLPKILLPAFGVKHEIYLAFIPPFIGFVIVLTCFKVAGYFLHKKAEVFYKHKASETQSGLWNRLNQRLGICVGILNGVVYFFLVSMVISVVGYFTIQVASSEEDHWSLKGMNVLVKDMDSADLHKAIAPINPATSLYFDAVDIIGYIYHTPLLQKALSTYPVFLPLAEQDKFKRMGEDTQFQQFWVQGPTIGQFIAQGHINPLVKDTEFYKQIMNLLENDLTDLKGYLESGESKKYGSEKILGPWHFSFNSSYNLARRKKPNMTLAERKWTQNLLRTSWDKSVLTAYLDGTIQLKNRSGKTSSGTWEKAYGNKYEVTIKQGSVSLDLEAIVEPRRMTLSQENIGLIFKK